MGAPSDERSTDLVGTNQDLSEPEPEPEPVSRGHDPAQRDQVDLLCRELEALERAWGGARSRAVGELPVLTALLQSVRERDRRPDLTLVQLISEALALEQGEWRNAAIVLLDVDLEKNPASKRKRHELLAANKAYKVNARTVERPTKKRGGKSIVDLALEYTAEMLVRYGRGDRPESARLPRIDPATDLADVESSMATVVRGISQVTVPSDLDRELRLALNDAYSRVRWIQGGRCFLAATPALSLRKTLHHDKDQMHILSRRDETCGIAQDPGWPAYKAWMTDEVDRIRRESSDDALGINHTRLIVRSDPAKLDVNAIDLYELHRCDSLFTITTEDLEAHRFLHELTYGFALSTQRGFALISGPDVSPYRLHPGDRLDPHELATAWCQRTPSGGPMWSLVITDPDYVKSLNDAFEEAIQGATNLKPCTDP